MHIRKATIEDASRISYLICMNIDRIIENNHSTEQKIAWKIENTPKAIREKMSSKTIFCAFENNRLLGTIALDENEIGGFYVSYSKRGLGIGKKLLDHLEDYAKAKSIKMLTLTSTPSARIFYLKNGYEAIENVTLNINGVDFEETRMTKQL